MTIIIATCDRPDRLVFALACVGRAMDKSGHDHRVIVVDNGQKASARQAISACKCPVDYLQSEPYNKSAALNRGIDVSESDWLVFTDDDTLPEPDWLVNAWKCIGDLGVKFMGARVDADFSAGSVPSWLRPGRSGRVPRGPAIVTYQPSSKSGALGPADAVPLGSNMFVHRSIFAKCGTFDESLWRRCGKAALGCEDAEFGMRVRSAGEKIGYCHEAVVRHPVYPERVSVSAHLRWAFLNGMRERLLFAETGLGYRYLAKRTALSVMRCGVSLLRGDTAGAVCDLMNLAQAVGEARTRKRTNTS